MDIKILVTQMTELFIIMFLGYFIYKFKVVDDNFRQKFSRLILDVTQPAMILASVLKLEERQPLGDVIIFFVICLLLFFVFLPITGYLMAMLLRVKKDSVGLYTFMNTYSNVGFMGFPVINALCGPVGLFYAAIFNLVFNLSVYSIGIWMINPKFKSENKSGKSPFLTPGIIICILAIVIYFLNIHFPVIVTETISSVGSITSPSAMIIIGCSLASINLKSVFNEWRIYPWAILKQIAVPVTLWFLLLPIIKNQMVLQVAYILLAMPVANNAVLFATRYGGDTKLATKTVFITTLLSLFIVPLITILVM